MSVFSVKNVRPSDASLLHMLAEKCHPLDVHTHYTYWVITNFFNDSSFILYADDKPAGFITAITVNDKLFIWQIGILSEFRGKRLSCMLISKIFQYAKENNLNMLLSIAPENKSSYFSFEVYCRKNNYAMIPTDIIDLDDFIDESFSEKEILYNIVKSDKI